MSDFKKLHCTNTGTNINPGKSEYMVSRNQEFHTWGADSLWIIQLDWQKRCTVISATVGQKTNPIGSRCSVEFQSPCRDLTCYGEVVGYVSLYNKHYGEVPIRAHTLFRMSEPHGRA